MSLVVLPAIIAEFFNDPGFWNALSRAEVEHTTVLYPAFTSMGVFNLCVNYQNAVVLMDWLGRSNSRLSAEQLECRRQLVEDVENTPLTDLGTEKKFSLKLNGRKAGVLVEFSSQVNEYGDPYISISVLKE